MTLVDVTDKYLAAKQSAGRAYQAYQTATQEWEVAREAEQKLANQVVAAAKVAGMNNFRRRGQLVQINSSYGTLYTSDCPDIA